MLQAPRLNADRMEGGGEHLALLSAGERPNCSFTQCVRVKVAPDTSHGKRSQLTRAEDIWVERNRNEKGKRSTMTMTDPIADMLSRVRNANNAHHETVSMPSSKLKVNIAEILKQEGYIADYKVEDAKVGKTLSLDLKYGPSRQTSIAGLRRVSKPGLRVYAKSTDLPQVLGGLGVAIISTSQGLLTDRQAQEKGVGGEVLAYVW